MTNPADKSQLYFHYVNLQITAEKVKKRLCSLRVSNPGLIVPMYFSLAGQIIQNFDIAYPTFVIHFLRFTSPKS